MPALAKIASRPTEYLSLCRIFVVNRGKSNPLGCLKGRSVSLFRFRGVDEGLDIIRVRPNRHSPLYPYTPFSQNCIPALSTTISPYLSPFLHISELYGCRVTTCFVSPPRNFILFPFDIVPAPGGVTDALRPFKSNSPAPSTSPTSYPCATSLTRVSRAHSPLPDPNSGSA